MATITLKNVPEETIARLKARATANNRSMNREAIECLVRAAGAPSITVEQLRARHREQAARGIWLDPDEVDRFITEGQR